MEVLRSKEEMRSAASEARAEGKTVALVPTMGALHEGHLSLVRAAKARADVVVVSVFVNPTQFGPGEDFESYPRDMDRDLELLAAEEVSYVFAPTAGEMYAADADTVVRPGALAEGLCGAARPGHFEGVATVVVKLFAMVCPDIAFFGEKDYQQLMVVRQVVRDLDLAVTVAGAPIVREADGLAMSSRNAYLSGEERAAAPVLDRALRRAAALAESGETDPDVLETAMREEVSSEPLVELEYAEVVDAQSLGAADLARSPGRALIAARVGTTRLIDNIAIGEVRG